MLVGITVSFIEFNQPIKETVIFGGMSLFAIILTILFWTTIFRILSLQDKINSIYTDID
jgi:hypothetical protein